MSTDNKRLVHSGKLSAMSFKIDSDGEWEN